MGLGTRKPGALGGGTKPKPKQLTPIQLDTAADWASVSAGGSHTIAVRTDGSLWAWGDNKLGQLGDGSNSPKKTPVQVGTASDWVSLAAGAQHSAAIKTDGSLWTWGDNEQGQLGLGTQDTRFVPMQVGTANDWADIKAGDYHTVALKTDGTLWAWGRNYHGALGDESKGKQTAPVQIIGRPIPVTSITLKKATAEVQTGYSVILTATVEPARATNQAVTWSSSDEATAVVNERGKVTGITPGTATVTVTAEDGGLAASCEVTVVENTHGIDYAGVQDVIVSGSETGFFIDLNKEIITVPSTYTPVAFSIDGGVKWKEAKDRLSAAKFPKLLSKDLSLRLSDKPIDKTTKKPADGAAIVSFAKINRRPAAPKLAIN